MTIDELLEIAFINLNDEDYMNKFSGYVALLVDEWIPSKCGRVNTSEVNFIKHVLSQRSFRKSKSIKRSISSLTLHGYDPKKEYVTDSYRLEKNDEIMNMAVEYTDKPFDLTGSSIRKLDLIKALDSHYVDREFINFFTAMTLYVHRDILASYPETYKKYGPLIDPAMYTAVNSKMDQLDVNGELFSEITSEDSPLKDLVHLNIFKKTFADWCDHV